LSCFPNSHIASVQEQCKQHKYRPVCNPHANCMAVAISPNGTANFSVSTVAAQKIMPVLRVSVMSISSEIEGDNDKRGEIDEGQNEDGD